MTIKRKNEIKKALQNGFTVILHRMIKNSPNYEKRQVISKFWRNKITTTDGNEYQFVDGDLIVITQEKAN